MRDITLISSCIAMLDQYKKINFLSLSITAIVFVKMLFPVQGLDMTLSGKLMLISVLVFGVLELIAAMHIDFDRKLLRNVSNNKLTVSESFNLLDRSLCQLMPARNFPVRNDVSERVLGCMGLLKKQVVLCCMQLFVVVIYVFTQV